MNLASVKERMLGFRLPLASVLFVLCISASCARVKVAESFQGVVLDAQSGEPLSHVVIQVRVMRVSSYDGTSQMTKFVYSTDANGRFSLPARKKIVDSVAERVEEIRYYDVIVFGKEGYEKREYRTDAEAGPFSWDNAERDKIVVRLKPASAASER